MGFKGCIVIITIDWIELVNPAHSKVKSSALAIGIQILVFSYSIAQGYIVYTAKQFVQRIVDDSPNLPNFPTVAIWYILTQYNLNRLNIAGQLTLPKQINKARGNPSYQHIAKLWLIVYKLRLYDRLASQLPLHVNAEMTT